MPFYLLSVMYTSHCDSLTPTMFGIILIALTYCNHPSRCEDILKWYSCPTVWLRGYWNKVPPRNCTFLWESQAGKKKRQMSHATPPWKGTYLSERNVSCWQLRDLYAGRTVFLDWGCSAMHTSGPLSKPKSHVRNPKDGFGIGFGGSLHLIVPFPNVTTMDKSPFSACHYYLVV